MKLFVCRGAEPNFGDELNEYLLPKVFGNLFDEDPTTRFVGIGSILYDRHPATVRKVVFSSGYGGYGRAPVLDASWDVYCVRGPRTARAVGLPSTFVAGDGAILLNRYRDTNPAKKYRFSYMPHFKSLKFGNWQRIAAAAGVHLIDPRSPVQSVLEDLQASEVVLAEAMHGAIVADALRVPWIALRPVQVEHREKWYDWAEALDLQLRPTRLLPSSTAEAIHGFLNRELSGRRVTPLLQALDGPFERMAEMSLRRAQKFTPSLSSDSAMDRAVSRLDEAARRLIERYT